MHQTPDFGESCTEDRPMSNVINLSNHSMRCGECRHNADCPLLDEHGQVTASTQSNKIRVLHAGDHLYRAGDAVDALFRMRTGVVKTTLTGSDGDEQVTGFFGAGEWVGLDALGVKTHRSDATVLDTASVCVVPANIIHERMMSSTRASRLLLDILSRRLMRKENIHLSLARDNAAQRMATFLLDLSAHQSTAGLTTDNIALPMSRGEIASYLALAVETVSRLLTRMQRDRVLEVHRHNVEILDRGSLIKLSGHSDRTAGSVEASSARGAL
jgi:CRP/FNR family transcriptional regulator